MTPETGTVLYLHGRGDSPDDPPGDLVLSVDWPAPLRAPIMDDAWHARAFAVRVDRVEDWLGSVSLAIGHSFGGWLLLCAGLQVLEAGEDLPPFVLLSSVLGPGVLAADGPGRAFSTPPRVRRVQSALGMNGAAAVFPDGRLELVHALDDPQCPVALAERLGSLHTVTVVDGGHRLQSESARDSVRDLLERWRLRLAPKGEPWMDETPTHVVHLPPGASHELEHYSWSTPGSHDYKSEGFSVERIEDARGVEYFPEWGDEPIEIFPGCVTDQGGARRLLRISTEACPVRVLYVHWFQYSGSRSEHDSSWRTRTWYRFELEEGSA